MTYFCHHVGILTAHPQKLIKFYSEKIGFDIAETKDISEELMVRIFGIPSPATLTKLKLDQVILEIISLEIQLVKKRPVGVAGYNHWGVSVSNKEAFIQELKAKGVPVLEVDRGGRTIIFVVDPDGNLIEIYEAERGER